MVNFLDINRDAQRFAQVLADYDRRLQALERTSQAAHTSIEGGAMDIYDSDGTLKGSIGVQPDGAVALVPVNAQPPPTPAAPTVQAVLAGLTVGWDGTWDTSYTTPADFSLIQVHIGTAEDFVPDVSTLAATITAVLGGTATIAVDGYTPVWVRLVGQNTAGSAGPPSAPVQGTPRKAVGDDLLDGIVTALKLAEDAVTEAAIAAGAVGTTAIADDAITTPKMTANSIDGDRIAAGTLDAAKIVAESITAAQLAALSVTADKIAANSITAGKIKAGSITAEAFAADALNGRIITGGTITSVDSGGSSVTLSSGSLQLRNSAGATVSTLAPGGYDVYGDGGVLEARVGRSVGLGGAPGFITYSSRAGDTYYSALTDAELAFGVVGTPDMSQEGFIAFSQIEAGFFELLLSSGTTFGKASAQMHLYSADAQGNPQSIVLDAGIINAQGVFRAGNIASGHVTITPRANTPTPLTITGLNLQGTTFQGFATANTSVPGTMVIGVGVTDVTSTGITVWLTRTSATATGIDWMIIGN